MTQTQKTWTKVIDYFQTVLEKEGVEDIESIVTILNNTSKTEVAKLLDITTTTGRRKRKEKDPDMPKKPRNGFIFYCTAVRGEVKDSNPDMKATDITREMGRMWKDLSKANKKPFEEQAANDKVRYREEMENYSGSESKVNSKSTKPTKPKQKRRLTSYMHFYKDTRPKVKDDFPEMKTTDITKEVGKRWRELSPEDKKVWEDLAAKGKENENETVPKTKPTTKRSKPKPKPKPVIKEVNESDDFESDSVSEVEFEEEKSHMTGFLLFSQEQQVKLKKKHPKWKPAQLTKQLNVLWKELDEDEQDEYNDQAMEMTQNVNAH